MKSSLKFINNLTHKGALFIEYALILAFVLFGGVAFLSSNDSMSGSVKEILTDARRLLGFANADFKYKAVSSACWLDINNTGIISYVNNSGTWYKKVSTSPTFENLGEAGTYEIAVDLDTMAKNLVLLGTYSDEATARTEAQKYLNRTNIGIWCVEGSNITNESTSISKNGEFKQIVNGTAVDYKGVNWSQGEHPSPTQGDSAEIKFNNNQIYQLTTTKTTSVGYNIVSSSQEQAKKDIDFTTALVNGGITYTKK